MTHATFTVSDDDTAIALGSGDVPVLGTPRLLAWIERVTVLAAQPLLTAADTTVGVEVSLTHSRASAVGSVVAVEVVDLSLHGRRLVLEVVAREVSAPGAAPPGTERPEVGRARVVRALVDREQFLARVLADPH